MAGVTDLRLFALLASRLCHELAGPVAAFGNGVEMLADPDSGFAQEATEIAAKSAADAADRLKFYRFAYGFGGGAAASETPAELARRLFAATAIACDYAVSARRLPPAWQRLACNLLLVGADGLPRGGMLRVSADPSGLIVDAVGTAAALAPEVAAALAAAMPPALGPRAAQAYFSALLAGELGLRLAAAGAAPGRVRIVAEADRG